MKNMIVKFMDKMRSTVGGDFLSGSGNAQSRKVSFLDLACLPFGIVIYFYRPFFKTAVPFALLVSVFSFLFGYSYGCVYVNQLTMYPFKCSPSLGLFGVYFLVRLLFIGIFLKAWYHIALRGDNSFWQKLFVIDAITIKTFLALLAFCLVNCLPILSLAALIQREPNPNWIIESLYFAVVSSGLWLPFVALRLYSIVAFTVEGEKVPPLKEMFIRSSGNTLKMIMSISLLLLLGAIVLSNYGIVAYMAIKNSPVIGALAIDFVYNLIFLVIAAGVFNYSLIQQSALFGSLPEGKKE